MNSRLYLHKTNIMPKDIIFQLLNKELERQRRGIELIASENFTSQQVMNAMGSVATNKYAEGYPNKRYSEKRIRRYDPKDTRYGPIG